MFFSFRVSLLVWSRFSVVILLRSSSLVSTFSVKLLKADNDLLEKRSEYDIVKSICSLVSLVALLLHFGAKFKRQLVISHLRLQNCHGNVSYMSAEMASRI